MGYFWGILLVLGFIFAAIVWVGMATWDTLRGLFRRISGEVDDPGGPGP